MAGETTSAVSKDVPFELPAGMFLVPFPSLAYATTQLELNDVMEVGYLPACTVYGFHYKPSDMDTNVSPLVQQKMTIGSTDVATALTGAQTGTASYQVITPITLTTKTLAKITTTAVPATAASGTVLVSFVCQK